MRGRLLTGLISWAAREDSFVMRSRRPSLKKITLAQPRMICRMRRPRQVNILQDRYLGLAICITGEVGSNAVQVSWKSCLSMIL